MQTPAKTFAMFAADQAGNDPKTYTELTSMRPQFFRILMSFLAPALFVLAGCGGGTVSGNPQPAAFSISPGANSIDTNCTGCNSVGPSGTPAERFSVIPAGNVTWSVSGGDAVSGAGTISATGLYTPPTYLTADKVQGMVTATPDTGSATTAVITLTPGFLQPLTPENVALGANGTLTITGLIAEAGGTTGIEYALSNSSTGSTGGEGSLGTPSCQRGRQAFTSCTVTYTAPATVAATGATYVVATVGTSPSKTAVQVLLNTAGVSSNPVSHQVEQPAAIQLGTSGGNNRDYDTSGNAIVDCCGGTLGSLVQDSSGTRYLLSNNHVLARSDHATAGDSIVQPGLIDNNCTPNGDGPGTTPVATLTGWLALNSNRTNADAAIAQVHSGAVDPVGSILELGAKQPDGTLGAAPPGVSSTGGKGELASLQLTVAKSGRTTGLTCANVSALNLDVNVDYFQDCAETKPYLTKTYTNQVAISGNQFSDAGDSGSLVVDAGNAEPVGLFFAGGIDAFGVGQGVANPVADVLNELSAQVGNGTTFTFVGGADHAVSCLNYGGGTVAAAQSRPLADAQITRSLSALSPARLLVNPRNGILGVAAGKSSDHPGEAAVLVYVDEGMNVTVPPTVGGVRTVVIPASARAVALGSAPQTPLQNGAPALPAATLNAAVAVKQLGAAKLMRQTPAFFGVGIGQSLDSPKEAALVIYVDRKQVPEQLPQTLNGLRTRYVIMDRLHVTRSYAQPVESRSHCMAHPDKGAASESQIVRGLLD
jgi:hypothetical protein